MSTEIHQNVENHGKEFFDGSSARTTDMKCQMKQSENSAVFSWEGLIIWFWYVHIPLVILLESRTTNHHFVTMLSS